jgi:transketolase
MSNAAEISPRDLCAAFEEGGLPRDEFWAKMREQHRLLEEYAALVGRGDLGSIEIHSDGLRVVFQDGLRMHWRPSDTRSVPSVTVNHGGYEPEEVRALLALGEHAQVMLDIGANAGFIALRLARAEVGPALIHAFEPVPSTHSELLRNIALNRLEGRVVPHALALGAEPGQVKFYVPAFHGSVAASARPLFASDENREVSVQMCTLDQFAVQHSLERIDLVKCDVEGAELFVLRGGLSTIERTRPVLMLEMLRKWAKVYGYHPNDIVALLTPLGYRCYSLGEGGLLEHTGIDESTDATNFFFLDPNRHAPMLEALEKSVTPASVARLRAEPSPEPSRELARRVRCHVLRMVHLARASHVGSCLSIADVLAVLYDGILRVDPTEPTRATRDRFILSKGHAGAALYAVLAERGFISKDWLAHYCEDGYPLAGHVVHKGVPGVEFSTGSLGHGLSLGAGIALGAARGREPQRAFVLLSDGECDEGSTWEAALFAAHHKLDNLIAIVDRNDLQGFGRVADVLALEPFAAKWRNFGWSVEELDGHDHRVLAAAFAAAPRVPGRPTLLIARTVKGKGVSFMEDQFNWHYRSPNADELARALAELGEAP